jgi:peptidyl-prolyl cis-trans isomerase C
MVAATQIYAPKPETIIIAGVLAMLSACQQQADAPAPLPDSPVAATVNGQPVYEADIDAEMNALPESLQKFRDDPKARAHLLRTIIRRYALSQKAVELGLDLDFGIQQRIEHVRRQILIEAAKEWRLARMEKIQDADIKRWFEQHRSDFAVPEQIHARHILVASREKALKIIDKLKRRRDLFKLLAARESLDDSNKARGGDLNWFPRGVMVKAFDDAAFKLKLNTLSEPVKTRFGWHVIEVLDHHPETKKPLEEVRDEIISLLQQAKMEQWIEKTEHAATVKIMREEYR